MKELTPAENLLKELGVSSAAEINIEAIAYHTGAIVRYRPLQGCEGRIVGTADHAVITVNSQAIPTRQRFSVAHELGHWQYHRGHSLMCFSDDFDNLERAASAERVANVYAADLLMPRFLFGPMSNQIGEVSFQAVQTLAAEFGTSATATAIRLVENGPEIAMLVCNTLHGRRWFYRSHHIPERWFPRDRMDRNDHAIQVLSGKTKHSGRVLVRSECWFDRWDAEGYELYEETYRITENEILTFLIFEDDDMLD